VETQFRIINIVYGIALFVTGLLLLLGIIAQWATTIISDETVKYSLPERLGQITVVTLFGLMPFFCFRTALKPNSASSDQLLDDNI